jgi:hypothetical protein
LVDGRLAPLTGQIFHDDRKPFDRWFASQGRYATREANWLTSRPWADLRWQDRVRRLIFIAPWLVPLYTLIARGGMLDGWPGVAYAYQRAIAELAIAAQLIDQYSRPVRRDAD